MDIQIDNLLKFIPDRPILSYHLAIDREQKQYLPGEIVVGRVSKLEADCAWIDLGLEKLAYIHLSQMTDRRNYKLKSSQDILSLNLVRDFIIAIDNSRFGLISLSINKIHYPIIAERLQQIYRENITIYTLIIRVVRQQILVEVEGILTCINPFMFDLDLNSGNLEGCILPVKIFDLQLTLEHQNYDDYISFTLMHDCDLVRARLEKYKIGNIVTATIKAVKHYGLIVNINNSQNIKLSGIIKRDEIPELQKCNLEHYFQIGREIEAMIIDAKFMKPYFSLSVKAVENI